MGDLISATCSIPLCKYDLLYNTAYCTSHFPQLALPEWKSNEMCSYLVYQYDNLSLYVTYLININNSLIDIQIALHCGSHMNEQAVFTVISLPMLYK